MMDVMIDEFLYNDRSALLQCYLTLSHLYYLCPSHSPSPSSSYSLPLSVLLIHRITIYFSIDLSNISSSHSYFISFLSLLLHFYQLCEPSNKELAAVGVELRKRLVNTRANVMKVTRSEDFSNGFQLLKVLYVHLYGVKSPVSPIGVSPLGISLKGTPVD